MVRPALACAAALFTACPTSGSKTLPDSGPADSGPAGATPDSGPFTLPVYGAGAMALDDAGCPPRPAQPDLFDTVLALADAGLNRCNITYPSYWHSFFALPDGGGIDDQFVLPYFNLLHDHPLLVPSFASNLSNDLDAAGQSSHPVSESLGALAARLGVTVTAGNPISAWAPDPTDGQPLVDALSLLGAATPDGGWPAATAAIPLPLQRAAATLLNGLGQAPMIQAAYFAEVPAGFDQKVLEVPLLINQGGIGKQIAPDLNDPTVYANLEATDVTPFANYAIQLALAVEGLNLPGFGGAIGFSLHVTTPLGAVIIDDAVSRTYEPTDPGLGGNILLLLKTGGDDIYRIPVGANQYTYNRSSNTATYAPAALAIDLGGQDTYAYDVVPDEGDTGNRLPSDSKPGRAHPVAPPTEGNGDVTLSTTPRQGAGTLGVGLLFDYGTDNDTYQSLRMSQGFGLGGVGVLFDQGGNDTYAGENMVQGAAVFGLGLLLDLSGDDVYKTYTQSQGFGFTRGLGALVDLAGDDQYLADVGDPAQGGDPLYYTPQLPGMGNTSMSQGAGYGLNDFSGRGMSGGIGILRDLAGNDVYQGSVFAQATGYYLGFGVLIDGSGDDKYDALWYTQGSAAHYAMSFFYDGSGDDLYEQHFMPKATGPNCGHDFSVGISIDNGGNDVYTGAGLCMGESNDLGTGIFINNGGNDTFNGTPQCFGYTTDPDYKDTDGGPVNFNSYGIFVKAGGVGTYTGGSDPTLDHSNSVAIQAGTPALAHGLFIDQSDAGPVSLP